MRRALFALALAAAASLACGKYGPPVRPVPERAGKTPPVAAPATSATDTEQCEDPKAPAVAEPTP